VSESNPPAESPARTVVGLAALLATLLVALVGGTAVFIRLTFWLPDAATRAGLVTDVSTPVVALGGVVGAAAAVAVVLAVLYAGSRLFAAVEAWLTS
jgi:hypothetical protein